MLLSVVLLVLLAVIANATTPSNVIIAAHDQDCTESRNIVGALQEEAEVVFPSGVFKEPLNEALKKHPAMKDFADSLEKPLSSMTPKDRRDLVIAVSCIQPLNKLHIQRLLLQARYVFLLGQFIVVWSSISRYYVYDCTSGVIEQVVEPLGPIYGSHR